MGILLFFGADRTVVKHRKQKDMGKDNKREIYQVEASDFKIVCITHAKSDCRRLFMNMYYYLKNPQNIWLPWSTDFQCDIWVFKEMVKTNRSFDTLQSWESLEEKGNQWKDIRTQLFSSSIVFISSSKGLRKKSGKAVTNTTNQTIQNHRTK